MASPRPVPPFCRVAVESAWLKRPKMRGRKASGIPEAFRPRIFGRFNQADSTTSRQKGGTGLGLAICKRLIELMQGKIAFEDRPGGGTIFWFELPRHAEALKKEA